MRLFKCKHKKMEYSYTNIVQLDDMGYPLMLRMGTCVKCNQTIYQWIDVGVDILSDKDIVIMNHSWSIKRGGDCLEKSDIKYKIVKELSILSEGKGNKKELNIVSWNGGDSKIDIRTWKYDSEGNRVSPLKGITLSYDEGQLLVDKLTDIDF